MGQKGGAQMEAIDVSPEMLALVGTGDIGVHRWPHDPVVLEIRFGDVLTPAQLLYHDGLRPEALGLDRDEQRLLQIVARSACLRLLGRALDWEGGAIRYLPAGLQSIALAIRDCRLPLAAAVPYRLAKNIELFCEIIEAERSGALGLDAPPPGLTSADRERLAAARQLIEQKWSEKLTLEQIARSCGINRSKLARGFRELYHCTVTEALAERRLAEARRQLIATDLPVALIGYRNGYRNNAAFTRAFGRRFGLSPSNFRSAGVAA